MEARRGEVRRGGGVLRPVTKASAGPAPGPSGQETIVVLATLFLSPQDVHVGPPACLQGNQIPKR